MHLLSPGFQGQAIADANRMAVGRSDDGLRRALGEVDRLTHTERDNERSPLDPGSCDPKLDMMSPDLCPRISSSSCEAGPVRDSV
jgi:hypothetical protein